MCSPVQRENKCPGPLTVAARSSRGLRAVGSVSESVAPGKGDWNEMRCEGKRRRASPRCCRCKTPACGRARNTAWARSWRERDAPVPGGPCAAVCFAWRTRRIDWLQVTLLGISSLELKTHFHAGSHWHLQNV